MEYMYIHVGGVRNSQMLSPGNYSKQNRMCSIHKSWKDRTFSSWEDILEDQLSTHENYQSKVFHTQVEG